MLAQPRFNVIRVSSEQGFEANTLFGLRLIFLVGFGASATEPLIKNHLRLGWVEKISPPFLNHPQLA